MLPTRTPHISAAVSTAILIYRLCHIACLIMISLSNCVHPSVLICRHLHHPIYLPPTSLLFYVSAASLLLLFPPSHVPPAVALPYFVPSPVRKRKNCYFLLSNWLIEGFLFDSLIGQFPSGSKIYVFGCLFKSIKLLINSFNMTLHDYSSLPYYSMMINSSLSDPFIDPYRTDWSKVLMAHERV